MTNEKSFEIVQLYTCVGTIKYYSDIKVPFCSCKIYSLGKEHGLVRTTHGKGPVTIKVTML